jgi:hypothetical protein
VDTVGLDQEMIRKYVKWQEKEEQKQEEFPFPPFYGPSVLESFSLLAVLLFKVHR